MCHDLRSLLGAIRRQKRTKNHPPHRGPRGTPFLPLDGPRCRTLGTLRRKSCCRNPLRMDGRISSFHQRPLKSTTTHTQTRFPRGYLRHRNYPRTRRKCPSHTRFLLPLPSPLSRLFLRRRLGIYPHPLPPGTPPSQNPSSKP